MQEKEENNRILKHENASSFSFFVAGGWLKLIIK